MDHLRRLGNRIPIPIKPDKHGFTGRECPLSNCEGYFKIEFGTGLMGDDLPCHCPYCGHTAKHDHFWTKEQIEFAKSVVMRKITDAVRKDLKKMEVNLRSKGPFGIGLSLTFKPGSPVSIRNYREKQLETDVVCADCTLRYSVYGVFAFCPDCGQHNSLQILEKNIELVAKMVDLAASLEGDIGRGLVENSLEDCVSVFDGFGRELCRVFAGKANNASVERISFQNLEGAKRNLQDAYGIDLASEVTADEWRLLVRAFQKRHLIAHRMGVVDQAYVAKAADREAVVGRRIRIKPDEVRNLLRLVGKVARGLSAASVRQELHA